MANPVIVAVPAGVFTKVATNVTTGQIHRLLTSPALYLQTYRLTGEAAPTLKSEGALAFELSHVENISASVAIDIYLWAIDNAGSVRVDL